jgi:hypothetical protein
VGKWRREHPGEEIPGGHAGLVSPHDPDARCAVKRATVWDGYKAHFTETCDPGAPHLVASSATTPAAADDSTVTARYATRAGVEGTIAQAVHRVGARRTRYRGLPKARLHTILAAAALNAWLTGTPLATTRTSHFSQLALALALTA